MTQNTGNWIDTNSVQATYNRNAVPGNDQMTQVEGWLQTANGFDWSTGPGVSQKQKRAVPDVSIVINCQPEQLKVTVNSDYPNGIYYDLDLGEYVLKTQAMDACMGSVDADNPILLQQKSAVGQNTFYTIFICAAAKATVFQRDLTVFNFVQGLAEVTSNTMWQQRGMTWNLGPTYSITSFFMMDSMFLAALLAIAQQSQSYAVYSPLAPGLLNLWAACFQSGTQHWNNPTCMAVWVLASYLLANGVPVNSNGYIGAGWNAPNQVAAVRLAPPQGGTSGG